MGISLVCFPTLFRKNQVYKRYNGQKSHIRYIKLVHLWETSIIILGIIDLFTQDGRHQDAIGGQSKGLETSAGVYGIIMYYTCQDYIKIHHKLIFSIDARGFISDKGVVVYKIIEYSVIWERKCSPNLKIYSYCPP